MQVYGTPLFTEANTGLHSVFCAADFASLTAPIASYAPAGRPEGKALLAAKRARTSSQGTKKATPTGFANLADAGYSDIPLSDIPLSDIPLPRPISLQLTRQALRCGPLFS